MSSSSREPSRETQFQSFIKSQFWTKPVPPPESTTFVGQTAIVTGSNCGIGLAAVRVLLQYRISHVILAVRSLERGEAAASSVRTDHPNAKIEVWPLDMLSYESIQKFASRCNELTRLDMIILNAGVIMNDFILAESTGHETTFQVNYLSTALLALLLLPILNAKKQATEPNRMTLVASGLGVTSQFTNRDADPLIPSFDVRQRWFFNGGMERYAVTKTLILMLVQKLGSLVNADDIVINAVEPGLTGGSQLWRQDSAPFRAATWLFHRLAARSLEQGAWAYIDAVAVKGTKSHGSLLLNWDIHP